MSKHVIAAVLILAMFAIIGFMSTAPPSIFSTSNRHQQHLQMQQQPAGVLENQLQQSKSIPILDESMPLTSKHLMRFASKKFGIRTDFQSSGVCPRSPSASSSSSSSKTASSCQSSSSESKTTERNKSTQNPFVVRIACVGDSITAGNRTHDPTLRDRDRNLTRIIKAGNYPFTLKQLLENRVASVSSSSLSSSAFSKNAKNANNKQSCQYQQQQQSSSASLKFDIRNFGASGATVSQGSEQSSYRHKDQFRDSLNFKPHIVIIMLGTNDGKTESWESEEKFVQDYESLVEKYQQNVVASFTSDDNDDDREHDDGQKGDEKENLNQHADRRQQLHHPWIIVATPLPFGDTDWVIKWKFDTSLLQSVVRGIRQVSNKMDLSLIDFHSLFNNPSSNAKMGRRNRDNKQKMTMVATMKSNSSPTSQKVRNLLTCTRFASPSFNCLFSDGVHPHRKTHDFIAEFISKKLCSL